MRTVLLIILFALVEYYFYANLIAFGSEHRYPGLLAMVGMLSVAISMTTFNFLRTTRVRGSVVFVFIYIAYYSFRCAVDLPDNNWWRRILGSDSGMAYYYFFGIAMSLPLQSLVYPRFFSVGMYKLIGWLAVIYILFTFLNSMGLLAEAYSRSRDDIFLLAEGDDSYQWPGDLLSIRFLIITTMLGAWLVFFWNKKSLIFMLTRTMIVCVYIAQVAVCVFYAQILGSNKAALILGGCFFSILWLITLLVFRGHPAKTSYGALDRSSSISLREILKSFVGAMTVAIGIAVAIALFFWAIGGDVPIEKFRIFGFESGEVSSIESRIRLIQEEFVQQFGIAPIFGNANAELLQGGEGRYIHSIFFYALTHTGVLGLLLFFMALTFSVTEAKDSVHRTDIVNRYSLEKYNVIRFLYNALFLLVFVGGVFSSSLLWALFWFALGFLMSPVIFDLRLPLKKWD